MATSTKCTTHKKPDNCMSDDEDGFPNLVKPEVKKCTCDDKPPVCLRHAEQEPVDLIDPEIAQKMEVGFTTLSTSNSPSLLKKYLTTDVFTNLRTVKTSCGATLLDCIRSGLENLDSKVGIYASDPEAYQAFNEIFDPLIKDYHCFGQWSKQPSTDWGKSHALGCLDPDGEYILSTRICCARSIPCYPFSPVMTEEHYKEIEKKVSDVLTSLTDDYVGQYYPLGEMSDEKKQELLDNHFLFKECDRYLQSANVCRFWPTGRGVFCNKYKSFAVWINEKDHVHIISRESGAHMGRVYGTLINGVREIEKELDFLWDERLGFLTFCPTNLGTALKASVHARLPKLTERGRLEQIADQHDLRVTSIAGEHSEAEENIYEISNKRRLGITEFQIVCEMYHSIKTIVKMERCM